MASTARAPAGISDHPTIRGHMNDRDKTRSRHVSGATPTGNHLTGRDPPGPRPRVRVERHPRRDLPASRARAPAGRREEWPRRYASPTAPREIASSRAAAVAWPMSVPAGPPPGPPRRRRRRRAPRGRGAAGPRIWLRNRPFRAPCARQVMAGAATVQQVGNGAST